jgi:hypothetical protein
MIEKPLQSGQTRGVTIALDALRRGELSSALSIAGSNADPKEGAEAFMALVWHLYRERRDVPAMIAASEAGVRFCLDAAGGDADKALARELKTKARAIAYNTAANCWPGWAGEGIAIEDHHLRSGLALAKHSRDLTGELALGGKSIGTARWLIGALQLACGEFADAHGEFQRAAEAFHAAGEASCERMAQAYMAMARKADPAFRETGERELREALAVLLEDGSKQALFFVDQIVTAGRLLFAW